MSLPSRSVAPSSGRMRLKVRSILLRRGTHSPGLKRKPADHGGALVRPGVDLHRAAVQLDEALDDGKAEARPAPAPALASRLEALEHRGGHVRRNSRAVVMNAELHRLAIEPGRKRDPAAFWSVVRRVAQEIVENLAHAVFVRVEAFRRLVRLDAEGDLMLAQP